MYCQNCGKKVNEVSNFCSSCRKKLNFPSNFKFKNARATEIKQENIERTEQNKNKLDIDLSFLDKNTSKEKIDKTSEEKNKKQSESFWRNLFKWNMDEAALKNQIEHYNSLGFFSSARKVATFFLILSAIINSIFIIIKEIPGEAWLGFLLLLVLALFIYKGHRWAMIGAMIYWTYSKVIQVANSFSGENPGGDLFMAIIWWAIYMGAFWQAYQVERARSKILKERSNQEEQMKELKTLEVPKSQDNKETLYEEQIRQKDLKYCLRCGTKLEQGVNFCPNCRFKMK